MSSVTKSIKTSMSQLNVLLLRSSTSIMQKDVMGIPPYLVYIWEML